MSRPEASTRNRARHSCAPAGPVVSGPAGPHAHLVAAEVDLLGARLLEHLDTLARRVAQQEVIEVGAMHLEAARQGLVERLAEVERLLLAVIHGAELRAVLHQRRSSALPRARRAARTGGCCAGAGIRRCGSAGGGPSRAPRPSSRAPRAAPRSWSPPVHRRSPRRRSGDVLQRSCLAVTPNQVTRGDERRTDYSHRRAASTGNRAMKPIIRRACIQVRSALSRTYLKCDTPPSSGRR